QVDDRDALAHRDLLGPEHLGDGLGPPAAGLHRGVVGDHHDLAALHLAHAGDHAGARRLAVVAVVRDQESDFEPGGLRVAELLDALARGELALLVLALDALGPAAL